MYVELIWTLFVKYWSNKRSKYSSSTCPKLGQNLPPKYETSHIHMTVITSYSCYQNKSVLEKQSLYVPVSSSNDVLNVADILHYLVSATQNYQFICNHLHLHILLPKSLRECFLCGPVLCSSPVTRHFDQHQYFVLFHHYRGLVPDRFCFYHWFDHFHVRWHFLYCCFFHSSYLVHNEVQYYFKVQQVWDLCYCMELLHPCHGELVFC